ncbi:MAG: glycosyltransferase [Desulfobacterales bacterium]|nr:glycosyltransferase [Desulfobacterales bacterium]
MFELVKISLISLYLFAACALMLYGLNAYVMIFLYKKGVKKAYIKRERVLNDFHKNPPLKLPNITTQIPIFNEFNVAERVIRAACKMEYPGQHEVQVLDDSTDETIELVDKVANELQNKDFLVKVIRRDDREGFKAGALAHGMAQSTSEFIAVFDADFVPPKDYLLKTIPYFLNNNKLGLVQTRWGHLNRKKSLLTRVQSIGIDGHFMVEQSARNWGNLFMNFNGTAGVWRKESIVDGGGWQWDTLTEDMDLSYRVQFKGWDTFYLPNIVVPAEIPEDINAFKSQQFRWAKGSIETAIKLFPSIIKMNVSLFKKIEAFFHLTHYVVHPLMLILAILALPVMSMLENLPGPLLFSFIALILLFSMSAPSALYIYSQKIAYNNWKSRIIFLPALVVIGTGIALSNTRAVYEAIIKKKSGFIRTPKKGDINKKSYKVQLPVSALLEILLGAYCSVSFLAYISHEKYLVGPFLAIYAVGFLYTGFLTIFHQFK